MNRLLFAACVAAVGSGSAFAAVVPPDFDAFYESPSRRAVPGPLTPGAREQVRAGQIAHVEPRLGVPTFFWAAQDPSAPSLRDLGLDAAQAARRHLFEHASLYRTTGTRLADQRLVRLHDTGRGAVIADFEKVVGGVPVFRDVLHVAMDRDLRLVALTGYLNPAERPLREGGWKLSRATAVASAFFDLTGHPAGPRDFAPTGEVAGGYHFIRQVASLGEYAPALVTEARVKDVWFGLPEGLVPAYYVEVTAAARDTDAHAFAWVLSAVDGRILYRHNLTAHDAYTYTVWADPATRFPQDGPQGDVGTPHPTGQADGFVAPFVAPSQVTLESGPISTGDPWLPSGAVYTIGNNVEAYADLVAPDGFTVASQDQHAAVNGTRAFDYPVDPELAPDANLDQRQGAITQIFYTTNFLHDWYYDNGFNEASGNAQADNYGRGGLDGDSLKVEGQDYRGLNNANMSTPADGDRPRMQMYLWSASRISALHVNSPSNIAGDYPFDTAGWGPATFDVTADAAYVQDSAGNYDGCAPYAAAAFDQKIAVIDRGACTFTTKVEHAQAAGAVGAIIVNNQSGPAPGLGGTPTVPITIGTLSLSDQDGGLIKTELLGGNPVNVRLFLTNRDATIDNSVVAHEWGHYLSNRLVGDANGLTQQQSRGMGEGWGDFNALLLLVREGDRNLPNNTDFTGTYGMTTYLMDGAMTDGYYFGLRRAPYSVDFSKNGLTFAHIEDGTPLPTTFPVAFGQSGSNNAEVHSTGEVWCATLWQAFVALLQDSGRLSFDQARERMKDYLVAGLKLTPNAPTFTEARDALLAAAYAQDPADFTLIADAFAVRGLGIGAVSPSRTSTSNSGVQESFLTGKDAAFVSATLDDTAVHCDKDGYLDNGETGNLVLTFKNVGHEDLTGLVATVTSTTPEVTLGNGGQVAFGAVPPFGTVSAVVPVTLTGATGPTPLDLEVQYEDPAFAVPGPRTEQLGFLGNFDETLASSTTDDVEAPTPSWTVDHDPNLAGALLFRTEEKSLTDHVWFGPDVPAPADIRLVSPPLSVGTAGSFLITFDHRYDFEADGTPTYYDGAVIEISEDGGQTWTDVGQAAAGYTGTITDGQPQYNSQNPLKNRPGYVGKSAGYDNGTFVTTTIDLGTAYAGKTVQVRFRIGCDDAASATGWELDNLSFSGITNTPFNARTNNAGVCLNRPPVAAVGPDQTVDERSPVVLDGSPSSDPDGDALTLVWTQTSGPAVVLTDGAFIAPEVTEDTALTFDLVVSDGEYTSQPATSTVTVLQKNRAPSVAIVVPEQVVERSDFQLTAEVYDPEGDALTYTWTQVEGEEVTHEPSGATLYLRAEEVTGDQQVTFRVEVSDGELTGAAEATFTVENVNRPPTADAGEDVTAKPGDAVTVGGESADPDGDALTYAWRQTEGPDVGLGEATGATLELTVPEGSEGQVLTFELTVFDGKTRATDRVNVQVEAPAAGGCGCGAGTGNAAGLPALLLLGGLVWFGRARRPRSA